MSKYSKYTFSTGLYLRVHGEAPRGRGNWAFQIAGEHEITPAQYTDTHNGEPYTVFILQEGWLTLTEAKKRAAQLLAEKAIPATTVFVAP